MRSLIFLNFLRIRQWYKNVIIFLPLIFAPNFLSVENIILITLGFFSLCLVLSASYVRNDINDIEDLLRTKKKTNNNTSQSESDKSLENSILKKINKN